jgi:recombination protein RecA
LGKKRKRQRQLDAAIAGIQRRYGSQSLVKGRPPTAVRGTASHVSTGFPALDEVLDGGLPKGSVCELLGPASSGKTTLALKFLAQAQRQEGTVAYLDLPGHLDPDYAHRCGLDLSRLWIGQPADLQEGLAMVEALVQNRSLAAVVLDAPDFFWDDPGQMSQSQSAAPGTVAAVLGRVVGLLARSEMVLLFLYETGAGLPASPPAVAHYAAVRLRVTRERLLFHHHDARGYEARVEVMKNRSGPAGRSVKVTIEFNGTVRGGNGL